jgi:PilZ domain
VTPRDARRAARAPHDSALELFDEHGQLLPAQVQTLVDISATGASFTSTRELAKGARVRGRVRRMGRAVFDFTGRVVRRREHPSRANSILYAVEFDPGR